MDKDLSSYEARFERFVDIYGDGTDMYAAKDVNKEMKKRWPYYAMAGCDMKKIVEMMSDKDVWYYYEALMNFGAELDIERFLKAFDNEFIKENWSLFIKRGASNKQLRAACSK